MQKILFIIDKVELKYFEFNNLVTNFWLINEFLEKNIEVFITTIQNLELRNNKAYTYLFKTDIRSNKLTHLALVVDGLTANLYLDGELKETITLDTTLPDVRSGYKIGADNRTTTPQPFKGTIYAVNIFSDARTAEEILTDTLLVPSDTDNLIYSNYITKK